MITALRSDISNYTSSLGVIKEKVEEWGTSDRYFHTQTHIFELHESEIFSELTDVFDASYRLLAHAGQVASANSLEECQSSVFYILRNSPSETFNLVNKTMFLFVNDENELRDKNFVTVEALFYTVSGAMILAILFGITPQIIFLERHNHRIWHSIFKSPFDNKVETKHRIVDRMQFLHNLELPASDTVKQDKHVSQPVPRIWLALSLKLSVLVVFSVVMLTVVVFAIYADLKDQLRTIPNYLNWSGIRACEAYIINYWVKEMKLGHMFFSELDGNEYFPSPQTPLNSSLSSIPFIKSVLSSTDSQFGIYTAQDSLKYKKYRYESACVDVNDLPDCSNQIENYGLYYALEEYTELARYLRAGLSELTWEDLVQFEVAKENFFYSSQQATMVYSAEASALVVNDEVRLVACVVVYAVLALLSYCLWYTPVLNAVGNRLADRANLLRMVAGK